MISYIYGYNNSVSLLSCKHVLEHVQSNIVRLWGLLPCIRHERSYFMFPGSLSVMSCFKLNHPFYIFRLIIKSFCRLHLQNAWALRNSGYELQVDFFAFCWCVVLAVYFKIVARVWMHLSMTPDWHLVPKNDSEQIMIHCISVRIKHPIQYTYSN